jgi:biotin carboxyl carrier protein
MFDFKLNFEGKEYNIAAELSNNEIITNILDIQNSNGEDSISKSEKVIKSNNVNINNNKTNAILAPISGTIMKILINKNDKILKDQPVAIIESMKMENTIKSDSDGFVLSINFKNGDTVNSNDPIINLK